MSEAYVCHNCAAGRNKIVPELALAVPLAAKGAQEILARQSRNQSKDAG
jgi:hypothetical protein